MNFQDANEERYKEACAKVKKATEKLHVPKCDANTLHYVDALPHKYARYYDWFAPQNQNYTADGKKALKRLQKALDGVKNASKDLECTNWRFPLSQNFESFHRLKLGGYMVATLCMEMAVKKTLEDAPALQKGRPRNIYQELVNELARDYKIVTGQEPTLSNTHYVASNDVDERQKPSGKFYTFVVAIFKALGIKPNEANIEHLIRNIERDTKPPNGWD